MDPAEGKEEIWFCFLCKKWLEADHPLVGRFKRDHEECLDEPLPPPSNKDTLKGLGHTKVKGIIWMLKVQNSYAHAYGPLDVLALSLEE